MTAADFFNDAGQVLTWVSICVPCLWACGVKAGHDAETAKRKPLFDRLFRR